MWFLFFFWSPAVVDGFPSLSLVLGEVYSRLPSHCHQVLLTGII